MLSNAYFLAKFRFDTAENEPAKNLQNFRKMHFRKIDFQKMHFGTSLWAMRWRVLLCPLVLVVCAPDAASAAKELAAAIASAQGAGARKVAVAKLRRALQQASPAARKHPQKTKMHLIRS